MNRNLHKNMIFQNMSLKTCCEVRIWDLVELIMVET